MTAGLRVIFTPGIQFADRLYQFALRNASSIVAYADTQTVFYSHFYTLSGTHLELVESIPIVFAIIKFLLLSLRFARLFFGYVQFIKSGKTLELPC